MSVVSEYSVKLFLMWGRDAMLTKEELYTAIDDCCNDFSFVLNGKNCGIFPSVTDSIKTYSVWYGDEERKLSSAKEVMEEPMFDGHTLTEIMNYVEIYFY